MKKVITASANVIYRCKPEYKKAISPAQNYNTKIW